MSIAMNSLRAAGSSRSESCRGLSARPAVPDALSLTSLAGWPDRGQLAVTGNLAPILERVGRVSDAPTPADLASSIHSSAAQVQSSNDSGHRSAQPVLRELAATKRASMRGPLVSAPVTSVHPCRGRRSRSGGAVADDRRWGLSRRRAQAPIAHYSRGRKGVDK